jgi:hypothetical protein
MSVIEALARKIEHKKKPSLSSIANGYLQDANHDYPDSAIAQAAAIALLAKEEGYSPLQLKIKLLEDEKQIDKLVEEANRFKIPYPGTTKFEDEEISLMTPEQMEEVIDEDFTWADSLMVLHPDELHFLTSRYPVYQEMSQQDGPEIAYFNYQLEAANMVRARYAQYEEYRL